MSEADWDFFTESLSAGNVARGSTSGLDAPPGGGDFVYGFNSRAVVTGGVALFHNGASFAPHASGAAISGAVKRGLSGARTGFSPFLILCAQGASVDDQAYLIGLSDDDPYHIVLRKGLISAGLPTAAEEGNVLAKSTETFEPDIWHHLRAEAIKQLNGDVIINVFANDLNTNPLNVAPDWQPIEGLAQFVDDALGVNSGSAPFTSGRSGYGFACSDSARRGYFDHITLERQT